MALSSGRNYARATAAAADRLRAAEVQPAQGTKKQSSLGEQYHRTRKRIGGQGASREGGRVADYGVDALFSGVPKEEVKRVAPATASGSSGCPEGLHLHPELRDLGPGVINLGASVQRATPRRISDNGAPLDQLVRLIDEHRECADIIHCISDLSSDQAHLLNSSWQFPDSPLVSSAPMPSIGAVHR